MRKLKTLTAAELADTTAIRNALDAAGVAFPRGARLPELREIYEQSVAKKSAGKTIHTTEE